jgi:hypothetical protein
LLRFSAENASRLDPLALERPYRSRNRETWRRDGRAASGPLTSRTRTRHKETFFMNKRFAIVSLLGVAATAAPSLFAADHVDSPAAVAEPTADITDLYAWMSAEAQSLNLVMNVAPFSEAGTRFSDAVAYVFHVGSSMGYGDAQTETPVICQFYSADKIECWAGDEYVEGDPSSEAGIASESGKLRVFAGMRNDPFFFELTGFTETVKTVVEAAPSLTFDDEGCAMLDAATSSALVGQLQSGQDGAPATDTFAGANVLSLVVQIDKSAVSSGGPLLGIWASTHKGGQ